MPKIKLKFPERNKKSHNYKIIECNVEIAMCKIEEHVPLWQSKALLQM